MDHCALCVVIMASIFLNGLGWVTENGPTSMSEVNICFRIYKTICLHATWCRRRVLLFVMPSAVLALIARLLAATVARWTLLQAAVMDEVLHVHA